MSSNSGYNTNPSGGVEPNFFNLSNDRDKKKNTTSDVDENAYWATSPPPYTPTSTSSEPSAPPLDPEYRQQQQYPPQGYNQYPQYGSTIQTPNSTATNWPWRAPPPAANNNNGRFVFSFFRQITKLFFCQVLHIHYLPEFHHTK